MNMNIDKNNINKPIIVNIVCAVLIVIGIYFWSRGYTGKPDATNMDQYTPWGWYIALFLFFEAVGAGALFIAAINKDAKCRLQLAMAGTVCILGAGLAIMLDLGGLLPIWRLFFAPNITSPILWDVWFVLLSTIFGIGLIQSLSKGNEPKTIAALAAIVSVLLPIGTAILFVSLPGRIGWGSSLEVAGFLAQAALAGVCFLILFSLKDYIKISKWAAGLFLITLILAIVEICVALYQSSVESLPLITLMTGEYAVLFWLWIIAGLVIPLVLSFKAKYPALTAGLGLFGILAGKFLFTVKGNLYPFLRAGEGVKIDLLNNGLEGYQKAPVYVPGIEEFLVGLAVFAFIFVAYNLLNNIFTKEKASTSAINPDKGISEKTV
jgi:Ni/Fe-hydrogenase subunit HybB-like protein